MNEPLSSPIRRRDFMIGMGGIAGASLLGGSAFAQGVKPATISEAIHLGFYIPTYVAQRKGIFKKHGFDMTIKSAGGIAQPVPALLSKAAQFAVTGTGMSVNATVEGQTTAHFITDRLAGTGVRITRLAHGVPVGGELDYLDEGTLSAAMRSRTPF